MSKPTSIDARLFHEIVSLIHLEGVHGRKSHGEWIKFPIQNDLFLHLDTWNRHMTLSRGSGEYKNEVVGFEGKTIYSVGSNWGELNIKINSARLAALWRIAFKRPNPVHCGRSVNFTQFNCIKEKGHELECSADPQSDLSYRR